MTYGGLKYGKRAKMEEMKEWRSVEKGGGIRAAVTANSNFGEQCSGEHSTFIIVAAVDDSRVRSCPQGGGGVGGRKRVKGGKGAARLRIGSWNIGTLTGKSIELAKILKKRKINIACVQESRWVGDRARDVDGFKLWFSGGPKGKNGVGILVDRELRDLEVGVRRVSDRLMTIKIVVGGHTLNMVSAYAPQASQDEEIKRQFGEDLDEVVRGFSHSEKLFLGGDFNGHIGSSARGYDDVYGGFGFGDRNEGGTALLDFAELSIW
ncbi:uncharacterized protein LOC132048918 [Lycium ferocissimum]|uniref:uncharacterized protein LOC132048918 n=1 Tax=Lycium ferocissimum TaxID=112874 RepID=UPI0028164E72|nr:uncharacterized protein LOC132048918 [Lycium ferocissimum]